MRQPIKSRESAELAQAQAEFLRQGGLIAKHDYAGRLVALETEAPPPIKDHQLYQAAPRHPSADAAYRAAVVQAVAPRLDVVTELRAIRAEADALLARLPIPRSFQ